MQKPERSGMSQNAPPRQASLTPLPRWGIDSLISFGHPFLPTQRPKKVTLDNVKIKVDTFVVLSLHANCDLLRGKLCRYQGGAKKQAK